jgi:hypothetical protein
MVARAAVVEWPARVVMVPVGLAEKAPVGLAGPHLRSVPAERAAKLDLDPAIFTGSLAARAT